MPDTSSRYDKIVEICRDLFLKKMEDYGTAWRILRTISLTDQIFIKAHRIRSIELKGVQKVEEDLTGEYIAIINYGIMAIIQTKLGVAEKLSEENNTVKEMYNEIFSEAKSLMMNKNHDYGEAWRSMRVSSFTDFILMKIYRTKQIEDNQGKTLVSEGVDANYFDMINYAVFALIRTVIEGE
ncbi:MAG: DUF1599 domain-containing protein [Bacteroidota bacterium]|nr:DUF1599 domain-containing protein [Bacteroidota bacterium]